jgi:carbon monoxide dehydrogenase subunit G
MDMTGERRIAAPRQVVWDALNDPAVLKASIPGCESLEKTSDTQMKATASVKIGPISARFTGNVQLTDIDPPNGYTIGGEGQGGVAGFAKGGAKVALKDDEGATLLNYVVNAQVGGKIAQLGARLIDATAKQMADAFFTRFTAQVEAAAAPAPAEPDAEAAPGAVAAQPVASAAATPATAPPPAAPPSAVSMLDLVPREPFGLPLAFWIGGGVFAVIILLFLASSL